QWLHAKSRPREPPMHRNRIGDRKGRKMKAAITFDGTVELAGKCGVGSLEQHFEIPAVEHRGDVAGAGRARRPAGRVGVDMHRDRRRGKARACERLARRLRIGDEMPDMIEKNFIAHRQPAIDHFARSAVRRVSASRLSAARSILLVEDSGRRSTRKTKRGCWEAGGVVQTENTYDSRAALSHH